METIQTAAIYTRGLCRRFGARTALDRVDLTVRPGEIHALLGPNGAGKTTLTRILCGLVDADGGEVQLAGRVGLVPSGDRTFYLRLSGRENLVFFARLNGLRLKAARARADQLLGDVGLGDAADRPVGKYSHGMQKRLGVARALLPDPGVLIVDEATHDLDPAGAIRVRRLVEDLVSRGAAVLWTTQRVEEINDFAHAVTFLHQGQVRFTGTVAELARHAPASRYVVTVRPDDAGPPPDAGRLQTALGNIACVTPGAGGPQHFLLEPARPSPLGAAIARLAEAGYDVIGCRRERAEIEEAFLALAERAA